MKKYYTLLVVLLIVSGAINAQDTLRSAKTFGGSQGDGANKIVATSDGGYIFVGYTNSYDGDVVGYHSDSTQDEIWVVKADAGNNIQWQKVLGGRGSETAYGILALREGGYLVTGVTQSTSGDVTQSFGGWDAWIVKLADNGIIRWQRSLGGSDDDYIGDAIQTPQGHYLIAGGTASIDIPGTTSHGGADGWAIEMDTAGTVVWQQLYGGSSDEEFYSPMIDANGQYYFAGYSYSIDGQVQGSYGNGYSDMWVIKTSNTGAFLQQATFGGDDNDFVNRAKLLSNGKIVLAGETFSQNTGTVTGNHGGDDAWIVEVDTATLTQQWQQTAGGTGNEYFSDVTEFNGQILLSGASTSNDGDLTEQNFGNDDYMLTRLNEQGNLIAATLFGGEGDDEGYGLAVNNNGTIYLCGTENSNEEIPTNHGNYDAWIIQLGANTATGVKETALPVTSLSVYPNPSVNDFQIQLNATENFKSEMKLMNLLGETIATEDISVTNGLNNFASPTKGIALPKGVYLLNITDNKGVGLIERIVVQ